MSNIFNLTEEYLQLMRDIEEVEGELTEDLENRLTINAEEIESKLKAYHHIIQLKNGEIGTIDTEIERLSKIKQQKSNLINRLKKTILESTLIFGYVGKSGNKKLDFDTIKFYTVNKEVLYVQEEENFNNSEFVKQSIALKVTDDELAKVADTLGKDISSTKVILRTELLKYLKSGEEVEGATIVINPYLMIK